MACAVCIHSCRIQHRAEPGLGTQVQQRRRWRVSRCPGGGRGGAGGGGRGGGGGGAGGQGGGGGGGGGELRGPGSVFCKKHALGLKLEHAPALQLSQSRKVMNRRKQKLSVSEPGAWRLYALLF